MSSENEATAGSSSGSNDALNTTAVSAAGNEDDDSAIKVSAIKRIMKLEPDTKQTSLEGSTLMAKATEMFMEQVLKAATEKADADGSKTVRYRDIAAVVAGSTKYEFLVDLIPEFPKKDMATPTKQSQPSQQQQQ